MRKVRPPKVEERIRQRAQMAMIFETAKIKELVDSGLSLSKAARVAGIEYKKAKRLYAFSLDSEASK